MQHIFSKMHKFILKYRLPISVNPTRISRMCMRKDVVIMYVKQHDRARCYTLFWGKNYDLSLLLTLQDENPKSKIRVYRKQYIRVSLNPCKPFVHALLGIMICSRWLLFLSNVHICQPLQSSRVVIKCTCFRKNAIYCHRTHNVHANFSLEASKVVGMLSQIKSVGKNW